MSTFAYTYDAEGIIQSWTRKFDAGSVLTSTFKYDSTDRLTDASVPTAGAIDQNYFYRYDKAGNRTSEQIDGAVQSATVNNLNQITGLSPRGPIRFEGSLNEPGTVTVGGTPAVVAADNTFKADVTLPPGTNTVAIVVTQTRRFETARKGPTGP